MGTGSDTNAAHTDADLLRASAVLWSRVAIKGLGGRPPTKTEFERETGVSRSAWRPQHRSPHAVRDELSELGVDAFETRQLSPKFEAPGRPRPSSERPEAHDILLGASAAAFDRAGSTALTDGAVTDLRRANWLWWAYKLAWLAFDTNVKSAAVTGKAQHVFLESCCNAMRTAKEVHPTRASREDPFLTRAEAFMDAVAGHPRPVQTVQDTRAPIAAVLRDEQAQGFIDGLVRTNQLHLIKGAVLDVGDTSGAEVSLVEYAVERLVLRMLDPSATVKAREGTRKVAKGLLSYVEDQREMLSQDHRRVNAIRSYVASDWGSVIRNSMAEAPKVLIDVAQERYYQFDLLAALAHDAALNLGTDEGDWLAGVIQGRLVERCSRPRRPFLEPEIQAVVESNAETLTPEISDAIDRLPSVLQDLQQDAWVTAVASMFNERVDRPWGDQFETARALRQHADHLSTIADILRPDLGFPRHLGE